MLNIRPTAGLFRHAGGLAFGTAAGQACIFLATPFLSRIYLPIDFGALAIVMIMCSYAVTVSCLRFDLALSSSGDEQRDILFFVCIILVLVLASLSSLFLYLISSIGFQLKFELIDNQPCFIGAIVACVGLYQVVSSDLVSRNEFSLLAVSRFLQGFSFILLAPWKAVGLSDALIASYLIAALPGLRRVNLKGFIKFFDVIKEHRKFPLLLLPGAVCDALATSIIVFVIKNYYGLQLLGEFSQIQRTFGAPLLLFSASLFQVYLRQARTDFQLGNPLRPNLNLIFSRIIIVIFLCLIIAWINSDKLILLFFGSGWKIDRFVVILCLLGLAVKVCVSPISSVLVVTGKLGRLLFWQVTYLVISSLILPFAASRLSFEDFLKIYVFNEMLLYLLYLLLIYKAAGARREVY